MFEPAVQAVELWRFFKFKLIVLRARTRPSTPGRELAADPWLRDDPLYQGDWSQNRDYIVTFKCPGHEPLALTTVPR